MKKWYLSKVLWANAIAILIFSVQQLTGVIPVLTTDVEGTLLAVLNIILRVITTTELTK